MKIAQRNGHSRVHMRIALSILLVFSLCSLASAAHVNWTTDFEDSSTTLGVSPETATFGGDAFAGIVGIPELYRSGTHAWMVNSGGTGTIQFETNAAEVDFWARTRSSATGDTVITAYDDVNAVIGSPVTLSAPSTGFSLVSFSGDIDHIDVVNNDSTHLNSVDDFAFTAIPEPTSCVLGMFFAVGIFVLSRRRAVVQY